MSGTMEIEVEDDVELDEDVAEPNLSQEEREKRNHDLHCLLDYISTLEGGEETEFSQEMRGWIHVMEQLREEPVVDPLQADLLCLTHPAIGVSRQLLALLRDCLLNQRWREAGRVLLGLMMEPMCRSRVLWRANCEIMWQLRDDLRGEMERYFKQMWTMKPVHKVIMSLENLFFLLSNNQSEEARDILFTPYDIRASEKTPKHLSTLYRAYRGLIIYTEWQSLGRELEAAEVPETRRIQINQKRTRLRRRACTYFNVLLDSQLVLDIFVERYTELLEYNDEQTDDALAVLQRYQSQHSDRPNALLYMLRFYQRHPDRIQNGIVEKIVKHIVRMNPTSPLLHDMVDKLDTKSKGTLTLLMTSLDYHHWRADERLWTKLRETLQLLARQTNDDVFFSRRDVIMKELWSLWKPRRSWWPYYHFVADDHLRGEILGHVTVTCCILCGTGSSHGQELLKLRNQTAETMSAIAELRETYGQRSMMDAV